MDKTDFDLGKIDIAWCQGCGNFGILHVLKQVLAELEIAPGNLVLVSGIGQAAKLPHYLKCNLFNSLHGRYLSAATAIKAVNPELTVIAVSGDGCTYGEGGNHFLHTIRRNPDITNIIHNNMVYGLTKGQASPTSIPGFKTPVQPEGVTTEQFNPLAIAIAAGVTFVARAYIGHPSQTKEILKKAVRHRGFAVVDTFQPCVSFNKVNTYEWFEKNTYYLENNYDPRDRVNAFRRSLESDRLPLGIFYVAESQMTFEEIQDVYKHNTDPLFRRTANSGEKIFELLAKMNRAQ